MAGSQKDIMELLLLTIHDQEDLRYIAETLHSHKYTVPTLLKLDNSDLEKIVDRHLSAASPGAKMGFKAAIQTRKENLSHVSPSLVEQLAELLDAREVKREGKRYAEVERITKQLAELLDAREVKREGKTYAEVERITKPLAESLEATGKIMKPLAESLEATGKIMKQLVESLKAQEAKTESWTLSNVNSQKWDILGRDSGLEVIYKKLEYTPKETSDLPPFGWDDRLERAQADRYLPQLRTILKARRLLVPYPSSGLRCIFELKKKKAHQGKSQVLASLLMANYLSPTLQPFAVLTDLIDTWHIYWIDGSTIHISVCESRSVAVGTVEDLLGEGKQQYDDSSGLPFLARDQDSTFSQIAKRRRYVPPGAENIEELVGLIPDEEIAAARFEGVVRHLQQVLQRSEVGVEDRGFPEGWYV